MKVDEKQLWSLRREYMAHDLSENDVDPDPVVQFGIWFQEVLNVDVPDANAMTLATASADGKPSARIVLLKGVTNGKFVFFSNYRSHKGRDLDENPYGALLFYWNELERQIRIEGRVEKVAAVESDQYFNQRPLESRISAIASPQSDVVESRDVLESTIEKLKKLDEQQIKRPEHWGGYALIPERFEFWQGRINRLHDRIGYRLENSVWKVRRLAP